MGNSDRAFRRSEAEAVSSVQNRFAHFQTKGTVRKAQCKQITKPAIMAGFGI